MLVELPEELVYVVTVPDLRSQRGFHPGDCIQHQYSQTPIQKHWLQKYTATQINTTVQEHKVMELNTLLYGATLPAGKQSWVLSDLHYS